MHNRREFMGILTLATGLFSLLKSVPAQAKKLAIPLAKAERLKTVGASAVLEVKDRTVLFVRDTETTIRALDPICTHKKCTVAYSKSDNRIECPCHGSAFGLDGKVLKGPATQPLKVYEAALSGDRIVLTIE